MTTFEKKSSKTKNKITEGNNMKKEMPTITIHSKGPEGNIYHILGLVNHELTYRNHKKEFENLRDAVFQCHSYNEAIGKIREHVKLVDIDNEI